MTKAAGHAAALVAIAIGSVAAGGCRCQTASFDQTFLLNGQEENPLTIDASLAGMSVDPGAGGAGGVAATPDLPPPGDAAFDCTAAAAGCTPGGRCDAACICVVTRARLGYRPGALSMQRCTLLATAGPPAVDVAYTITASGCGD